jgi:hypothetical protein
MSEKLPTSVPIKDTQAFAQRGGTLSISTSTPRPTEDVLSIQSPGPNSALPHPSPHRTFSGPAALPSSSIQDTLAQSRSPVTPKSAGYEMKSLRFEKGRNELKPTMTTPAIGNPKKGEVKRRYSADPKINVYTECGRHSDDWLFGGWNVTGTVKKIWERKDSKP